MLCLLASKAARLPHRGDHAGMLNMRAADGDALPAPLSMPLVAESIMPTVAG